MPSARITIRLKGIKECVKALRHLKYNVARRVLRRALEAAATPILNAAKAGVYAKAHRRTGMLKKSLGKVTRMYKDNIVVVLGPRKGFETTIVSPYTGKPQRVIPSKYAHFVEYGTDPHMQPNLGFMHPGAEPMPFMRPAYDANKGQAESILITKVTEGIAKEAAKVRSR